MLGSLNPDSEDSEGWFFVESATSGLIDRDPAIETNAQGNRTAALISGRTAGRNPCYTYFQLLVHKDQEACLNSIQIRDRPGDKKFLCFNLSFKREKRMNGHLISGFACVRHEPMDANKASFY